jgi:hypothetical protein
MIVMNIAATYTTLTATFWLTLLIITGVNVPTRGFLPPVPGIRPADRSARAWRWMAHRAGNRRISGPSTRFLR